MTLRSDLQKVHDSLGRHASAQLLLSFHRLEPAIGDDCELSYQHGRTVLRSRLHRRLVRAFRALSLQFLMVFLARTVAEHRICCSFLATKTLRRQQRCASCAAFCDYPAAVSQTLKFYTQEGAIGTSKLWLAILMPSCRSSPVRHRVCWRVESTEHGHLFLSRQAHSVATESRFHVMPLFQTIFRRLAM